MPLYEYQCPQCGSFELIRKFSDAPLDACPTCGRAVQKLPSAPAIQFKGTGWYITDYARKSTDAGSSAKPGGKSAATADSTPSKTTSQDGAAGSSTAAK